MAIDIPLDEREDWCLHTAPDGIHYVRVKFIMAELRDFGRDLGIAVEDMQGGKYVFAFTSVEARKLMEVMLRLDYGLGGMSLKKNA